MCDCPYLFLLTLWYPCSLFSHNQFLWSLSNYFKLRKKKNLMQAFAFHYKKLHAKVTAANRNSCRLFYFTFHQLLRLLTQNRCSASLNQTGSVKITKCINNYAQIMSLKSHSFFLADGFFARFCQNIFIIVHILKRKVKAHFTVS